MVFVLLFRFKRGVKVSRFVYEYRFLWGIRDNSSVVVKLFEVLIIFLRFETVCFV